MITIANFVITIIIMAIIAIVSYRKGNDLEKFFQVAFMAPTLIIFICFMIAEWIRPEISTINVIILLLYLIQSVLLHFLKNKVSTMTWIATGTPIVLAWVLACMIVLITRDFLLL